MKVLFHNPILLRFCRSELRTRKVIFWYLLVFMASAYTLAFIYVPQVVRDQDPVQAARSALLPILLIQGFVLLFMGTGSVAGGITKEKVENVLNYQRLTPLPLHWKILGYLFGLPIREYVLFSITLPFLLFILIVGRIPPGAFIPYYLVFFSSVLLYHFTGLVAGMISRHWRLSARISQILILLLYFVLPQFSKVGLVFLEFLTVRPVFAERILPLIANIPEFRPNGMGSMAEQAVPFFTLTISGTLFSFIIQSLLIILFAMIVSRKWIADTVQSMGKATALGTFILFSLLSLGNIWPQLTRSSRALTLFQSEGALSQATAVFGLPLILAFLTTLLAFVLMSSALPNPDQYRQGRLRARRLGRDQPGRWEDAASGYLLTGLFLAVQTVLLVIAVYTLKGAGYFDTIDSSPFRVVFLILCLALCLFYFQGLTEYLGSGKLALFALIHWLVPILTSVLIIAISRDLSGVATLVASASPLILILLGGMMLTPPDLLDNMAEIHRGLALGIFIHGVLIIWFHARLRQSRQPAIPDEHE